MTLSPRRILCLVATLFAVATLASCYLPNKFMSEIRLGRTGDFSLMFKGELVWAPLYRDIHQGTLKPDEIAEKVQALLKDLQRDTSFKSITSSGDGRFQVDYLRQGRLGPSEQVTFVRRNAIVLMIRSMPNGLISVNGNALKPSDAQMVTTSGMDIQGEFRIVTDGLVKEHNATAVKPFGAYRVYIWSVQNAFSPSPHFVMQREGAWPDMPEKK